MDAICNDCACGNRDTAIFGIGNSFLFHPQNQVTGIEKENLNERAASVGGLFEYLRVGTLNNHMLNVLQAENRTLDFHIYEASDELFYCIEGEFDIEFDDGLTHLCTGDFIIIPNGTRHRPVCKAQ